MINIKRRYKFVDIRDDNELKGLLIATAYGFCIMFSYYILRAVRDDVFMATKVDKEDQQQGIFKFCTGVALKK